MDGNRNIVEYGRVICKKSNNIMTNGKSREQGGVERFGPAIAKSSGNR